MGNHTAILTVLSHNKDPKQQAVPWVDTNTNPSVFVVPESLPPNLPIFTSPSRMTPAQLIGFYDHLLAVQDGKLSEMKVPFAFKEPDAIVAGLALKAKGKDKGPARKKAVLELSKEDDWLWD
jgi:hypothetical protein